jgi:HTH-type transcriptional regulator/antitoxin HigA
MLDVKIEKASLHWTEVSKILYLPHSEKEYHEAVRLLDNLIDTIGEDENHPLASLMEILGVLIEKYEDEHVPEITEI